MNNYITINFFPLENQDFVIPTYRKICSEQETKKDFSFSVKVFPLLTDNSSEDKNRYFVTFDKQDHFQESKISSLENRDLTVWYLSYLIKRKCDALNYPCKIGDDFFMEKSNWGQESICIFPSYLNRKYGIILDYHFFINKNIPHSIEMQKKSLSLGQDGRSNNNYYSDKYSALTPK